MQYGTPVFGSSEFKLRSTIEPNNFKVTTLVSNINGARSFAKLNNYIVVGSREAGNVYMFEIDSNDNLIGN